MRQAASLELLTNQYFWNIGSSNSLKNMIALDTVTIGNTSNGEPYTNITTSNVTSNLFIGNLDGQLGTLYVNGNMSGSVLITGNGTNATNMNLELELDDVNRDTAGPFGSQTEIPTFNVDKYGRVSQVANVTISTTLNLLDTLDTNGNVDLLNGELKINGTVNQILSEVSGNTFTLSLDNDINMENLSLSGNLDVTTATTLNSTLAVRGAASLHSTLVVGGGAILNSSLKVVGVSRYIDNIIAEKDVTINGNIFVRGNLTQVDAETILLSDPLIVIGNSNENTYQDLGFKFVKSASSDDYGYFGWDGSNSQFSFYETANIVDNDLQSGNLGTVAAERFVGNVVQASSFVGPLQGSAVNFQNSLTLDFCGNVLGSVTFFGNEGQLDISMELQSVFANPNSFGNSISVPTITVDTYGRVTDVSLNAISTTLSLLDINGNIGIVDLLNGNLRIDGTSRKVDSDVVGNTFILSLPNNLLVEDVSMNGRLEVVGSSLLRQTLTVQGGVRLNSRVNVSGPSLLYSTLDVRGSATLESSLYVGELVNFNKDLVIQGNLTVHGTETIINVTTLAIEDNKIELNTDGAIAAFGIYANMIDRGGEIYLYYQPTSHRWEFNRDLYVSGNLTVSDTTLINDTLAVAGASTLESSLDAVGAASLHSTLAVAGASTLESTLEVVANITAPQYFVKDNIRGNSIELVAPDLSSGSYTLTLPGTHGIAEQFLQTNGSGILSWVTPSDAKTIKAHIIGNVDYRTETDELKYLIDYAIQYNTTIQPSCVMLQHKIPYECSIHANQRIKFKIRKFIGATEYNEEPDILGPNNATGGTRGIYISNSIHEINATIGTTVTFIIAAQLTANTTAVDTDGNRRTAGVKTGPGYGVGTVMLTEFKN